LPTILGYLLHETIDVSKGHRCIALLDDFYFLTGSRAVHQARQHQHRTEKLLYHHALSPKNKGRDYPAFCC
jgi:hypothetical protein